VRELRPGLWHWEARHPDWTPSEGWRPEVSSYAVDDGEHLLLFDPLAVPGEIEELAADREPVVVLTAPWHERDTQSLVERLGAPVFAPPPDTQADLMRKYGATAEQTAGSSPDLVWLLAEGGGEAHLFAAGDRLPFGVDALPGKGHNDLVLWIEKHHAVVAGDTLADFGRGFEISPGWFPRDVTREQIAERLQPLLALPVELALPAHGSPTDRAALERVLS